MKVKLDIFEGPLDLLLHLIKKNRVDIYDIPIADITEQYLEYVDMIKTMNLDLAGEFLLMAATLIHIKSKMLLPIPEEEEEAEEGEDPREELVRKLLEYQRYKEAATELAERRLLGRDVFKRGMPFPIDSLEESEEDESASLIDISVFDLMAAFKEILKRASAVHEIDVTVDRFRVADKINHVLEILNENRSVSFEELFHPSATRGEVIVTFLAILELAKLLMIKIYQSREREEGSGEGAIRVYRAASLQEGESGMEGSTPEVI